MNRLLEKLARLLWPHIRPFVLDLLIAQAERQHAAQMNHTAAKAEQQVKRYVGE